MVDRSIMDEGITVGKFCYIGFVTLRIPGDFGITVVGQVTGIIPSHTAICNSCRVLPEVGPADFIKHVVGAGTIVSQHLAEPVSAGSVANKT